MTENASESTTRMGRFRICSPNSPGPPEQMSHGRFRIIPQSKQEKIWVFVFLSFVNDIEIVSIWTGTYGPTSPRFAVIPEEPSCSPSINDACTNLNRRTPSPDWDFTEVK